MSQGSVSRSQILPKTSRILLRMSRLPAWFECHGDVAPTDVPRTFVLARYVPWTICPWDYTPLGRYVPWTTLLGQNISWTIRLLDNMSLGLYASRTISPLDDTPHRKYCISLGRYVPE